MNAISSERPLSQRENVLSHDVKREEIFSSHQPLKILQDQSIVGNPLKRNHDGGKKCFAVENVSNFTSAKLLFRCGSLSEVGSVM